MAITRNAYSGLYSAHCDECHVEIVSEVQVKNRLDPRKARLEVFEMVAEREGTWFGPRVFCSKECRDKNKYVQTGEAK